MHPGADFPATARIVIPALLLAALAGCGGGDSPQAGVAPAPFVPMTSVVQLGESGGTATLTSTPSGGWTLDGQPFASGGAVTGDDELVYRLARSADGGWQAGAPVPQATFAVEGAVNELRAGTFAGYGLASYSSAAQAQGVDDHLEAMVASRAASYASDDYDGDDWQAEIDDLLEALLAGYVAGFDLAGYDSDNRDEDVDDLLEALVGGRLPVYALGEDDFGDRHDELGELLEALLPGYEFDDDLFEELDDLLEEIITGLFPSFYHDDDDDERYEELEDLLEELFPGYELEDDDDRYEDLDDLLEALLPVQLRELDRDDYDSDDWYDDIDDLLEALLAGRLAGYDLDDYGSGGRYDDIDDLLEALLARRLPGSGLGDSDDRYEGVDDLLEALRSGLREDYDDDRYDDDDWYEDIENLFEALRYGALAGYGGGDGNRFYYFQDIHAAADLEVGAAIGSTDHGRFGAWARSGPGGALPASDTGRLGERGGVFAHSPIRQSRYPSSATTFPRGVAASYAGRTVAVAVRSDESVLYDGDLSVSVRWQDSAPAGSAVTTVVEGLARSDTDAPLQDGGFAVSELTFAGASVEVDSANRVSFSGASLVRVGYADPSRPDQRYGSVSTEGKFVGGGPAGPQGVIGTWRWADIEGAFSADLAP